MRDNYLKFIVTTFLFISLFYLDLNAQWQKMSSPSGGYIQCIVEKDNILYAGTAENGLFYSSDNGVQWNKCSNTPGTNIQSLTINGEWIFTICEKGFFKSNDNGVKWQSIYVGNVNRDVKSQNGIIYLNDQNGVYMSKDNGVTWTLYSINQGAYNFGFSGNTVIAIPGGARIFISNDDGKTWQSKSLDYYVSTSAGAIYNNKLYIGTWGYGVYVSSNGGDSWKHISIPLMSTGNISGIVVNGNTIYVCSDMEGIYASSDEGISWNKLVNGLKNLNFTAMHISNNKIFAGTVTGIYASTDNGLNWSSSDNGIKASIITSFAANKNKYFLGTNHGLLVSQDNGQNWEVQSSALFSNQVKSFFVDNDNIFVGTTDGMNYSSNNGMTWVGRGLKGTGTYIYDIAKSGNDILAATNGGIYLSKNLGASWTKMTSGWPDIQLSILVNNGIVYTGGLVGGAYSEDGCKTWSGWSNLTNNTSNTAITILSSIGDNYFANSSDYGLYVSNDKGTSWNKKSVYPNSLTACNNSLFLGTSNGLLTSTDYGVNFNKSDTLTTANISMLENYNDVVYACANSFDIWFNKISTGIYNFEKNKMLFYPNPADKKLVLRNNDNAVFLAKIIDMTGKVIITYKTNNFNNQIDVSKLTNGIYLFETTDKTGNRSTNKLEIQHIN